MSKTRLERAREALEFAEVSEHNMPAGELSGFYAGWSIAAASPSDLCQGVIDRLNELLASNGPSNAFKLGELVGYVAYHRELISQLSRED